MCVCGGCGVVGLWGVCVGGVGVEVRVLRVAYVRVEKLVKQCFDCNILGIESSSSHFSGFCRGVLPCRCC